MMMNLYRIEYVYQGIKEVSYFVLNPVNDEGYSYGASDYWKRKIKLRHDLHDDVQILTVSFNKCQHIDDDRSIVKD